ncbi:unnamed protein product, partial [Chrysoparadoxa australica]
MCYSPTRPPKMAWVFWWPNPAGILLIAPLAAGVCPKHLTPPFEQMEPLRMVKVVEGWMKEYSAGG